MFVAVLCFIISALFIGGDGAVLKWSDEGNAPAPQEQEVLNIREIACPNGHKITDDALTKFTVATTTVDDSQITSSDDQKLARRLLQGQSPGMSYSYSPSPPQRSYSAPPGGWSALSSSPSRNSGYNSPSRNSGYSGYNSPASRSNYGGAGGGTGYSPGGRGYSRGPAGGLTRSNSELAGYSGGQGAGLPRSGSRSWDRSSSISSSSPPSVSCASPETGDKPKYNMVPVTNAAWKAAGIVGMSPDGKTAYAYCGGCQKKGAAPKDYGGYKGLNGLIPGGPPAMSCGKKPGSGTGGARAYGGY